MKDLLGQAIYNYYTLQLPQEVFTETSVSEKEPLDVSYWFRGEDKLSVLEQEALRLSKGKVLDIGCGSGCHSLILQEKGLDVTAIDFSSYAVKIAKDRGVGKVVKTALLDFSGEKFDTILLLMNGTGIFQELKQLDSYLNHLKNLLNPNGQILIDSSDLIYLFAEDEDGGRWIPSDIGYYGELSYTVYYTNETETFPWLYLDFNTLQTACAFNKLSCELLKEGEHYDYLARICFDD